MISRVKLLLTVLMVIVVPTGVVLRAYVSLRDATRAEVAGLRQQLDAVKATRPLGSGASNRQLASEVAQLRSQLLELRSVLEARSIQPTIASPAASSQPETPTQELGVRLEQTLQREPQTLEARRVADALGASILRVLPQRASLLQITCVASLCRAEIAYANAEQWQSFIETQLGGADNSFWPGPVYLQLLSNPPPPQGEVRALLYLGRGAGSFETRQDG